MFQKKYYLFLSIISLILAACSHEDHRAQGYIEGRYTYIATPVGGRLITLAVERGQTIKKDQLLFELDKQPEVDQYQSALENYKQAVASKEVILPNVNFARLTYQRYQDLVAKKAIQQSQLDQALASYQASTAQFNQASAQIAAAQASVLQAEWTKNQKKVVAPVDAIVFDTYYRLGEFVVEDQPVLALLAPADIKVIFFVSEPALQAMTLGDTVKLKCDGCEKDLQAKISFISPSAEYTPPVIYSNDTNAKLIYRIEADFDKEQAITMHPGQPVEVVFSGKQSSRSANH